MKRAFFLAATVLTALSPVIALAITVQTNLTVTVTPVGAGLLPADRNVSANWQMAGMLSAGGIPNRTTQCGSTVSPIGGGADDTANIRAAIVACPAGQVVQLSAGTFTVAEGSYVLIDRGITVRGAGPTSTFITRPSGPGGWPQSGCSSSGAWGATLGCANPGNNPTMAFMMSPVRRFVGNAVTASALTADATAGSTSVTVTSSAGFSVGQIVLLDEASGASYQPDVEFPPSGQIWASPDYRVVWQKHNPSQGFDDFNSTTFPYTPGSTGCSYTVNCDRPTSELKKIKSISSNIITFDSPVMISYRVSHAANLNYFATPFLQNASIENMSVSHADDASIEMDWCAYCWTSNVEHTLWLNEAFAINTSFRIQLEEFYIHDPAWPVNGGAGYNISLRAGTSECLIENGISTRANKDIVSRASGAGCVVAYNYMDDAYIGGQSGWTEIGLNGSHFVGSHHVLFEGNQSFNMDSDQTHGNSVYHTFFRNWSTGIRATFTGIDGVVRNDSAKGCHGNNPDAPLRTAAPHAYAYWFSFIGNVLGMSGCTTTGNGWALNGSASVNPAIWMLGWADQPNQISDRKVNRTWDSPAGTTIAHGNYDFVQNTVSWDPAIANHALPNSLYLSSAPAFFSGCTWPWVDPAGGTLLYQLPAKNRYDAGTPFAPVSCSASPTASLLANPTSLSPGSSSLLTWNSVGEAPCVGTNFATGGSESGNALVTPGATTTYTVTCGSATPASAVVTVTGTYSTWNPSMVSSFWALSNGNETATLSTGTNYSSGESASSRSSGLLYAEFQCANNVSNQIAFGMGNSSINLGNIVGLDGNSAGFWSDGRFFYNGSGHSSAWAGCVTGDTVGIEYNFSASTLAARTYHAGSWGLFSAAPVSILVSPPWHLAGGLSSNPDAITMCSNTTSCGIGPLPAGYSWWQ
jgi:hypothetical protein